MGFASSHTLTRIRRHRHILPPPLRPQRARRALAAAVTPRMPRAAFAEIAGVGVLADQIDQPGAAEIMRELPGRGLVAPHQRRVQLETSGHAEIERGIERADRLVAAIGIAGIIGLAHAADDVGDAAPIGQRGGKGQEHEVAAGHEGVGQPVGAHFDRHVAGQRGVGDFSQRRNFQRMAFAELCCPVGAQRPDAVQKPVAAGELDRMALAIVETERFDAREPLQRPGEAGRGILPAGEQHQRGSRLQFLDHRQALSTAGSGGGK